MTSKRQIKLSAILLVVTLLLTQCDAIAPKGYNSTAPHDDVAMIVIPIDHARIRIKNVVVTTVDTTIRHLDEEDEKKETIHKRSTNLFFPVLLATALVNAISLVALLSLIPILTNSKWSCFKSVFWVANEHLQHITEINRQYSSSIYNTVHENAIEQTAAHRTNIFVPAISCGAILATAVFLVIPQAIFFIQRGTSSDEDGEIEVLTGTIARFGAALLAGYMFPLVLGAFFPRPCEHVCTNEFVSSSSNVMAMDDQKRDVHQKIVGGEEKDDDEKRSNGSLRTKDTFDESIDIGGGLMQEGNTFDTKTNSSTKCGFLDIDIEGDIHVQNPTKISYANKYDKMEIYNLSFRLVIVILFSDATYNFFHGIFIGVAFLTCSNATAVCVTIITIFNELSQQVADYFLLTKYARVSIPSALLLIFATSLATILGAMIIISAGLTELAIGVFLAFASGIYLHISASECLPRVYSVVKGSRDRLFALTFIMFGALPVGLSLLSHGQCDK